MVRVPPHGKGENDNPWGEVTYLGHYSPPCLIRVVKVSVGQTRIPPLDHSQDAGGSVCLLGSELGAAPGSGLAGSQIEDSGPVAGISRLDERPGTGQLDVVAMGGNRQDVDGHLRNKA
jgi:hypothetical protein